MAVDQSSSPSSSSLDNEASQEQRSIEAEQGQRLLEDGAEGQHADQDGKMEGGEWHLRTGWVVAGSLFSTWLVFLLMVFFTKYYIAEAVEGGFSVEDALRADFRRPQSDYVLDANWDSNVAPKVRRYHWTILDRVANPDGVYRQMITINGIFPGPMIECNEGDTLIIEVDNLSVNATLIHFHGIFQNGTNWMDGSSGITQCPVAPKGQFQYEFVVEGQSGTYFYHAHQAVQMADGLFGPLVVHARNERQLQGIAYETDRVMMLQDYYHDLSSGLLISSLEPGSESDPIPDGALINGRNVRDCATYPGRLCDNATTSLTSLTLTPNVSHRLRFINVGASAWFEVSIDEHGLAVTEVDGTAVIPSHVTQLHISPGQRYSTVVTTDKTTADSFWLRARMISDCFSNPDLPGSGADEVRAIVQYSKRDADMSSSTLITQPTSRNSNSLFAVQCRDMDRLKFTPIPALAAPAMVDHSYFLRVNMEIGDWRLQRGFFNKSSFHPNLRSPSLHRILDGLRTGNGSFDNAINGINEVSFDINNELVIQHHGTKVVDLILQNFDESSHPMHLHGHKFWVIAQDHGYFPGYEHISLDLSNPLRRDTATAEGFGWVLLRFVTDNPGIWAFHCHMAWHSEAGLAMQFLSQPESMMGWKLSDAHLRLCEASGIERGAAPKDEIWFGSGVG